MKPDKNKPVKVEMLPIDALIPYENNPRDNEAAVEPVAASIHEFGFKKPIVVDKDMVILAGHTHGPRLADEEIHQPAEKARHAALKCVKTQTEGHMGESVSTYRNMARNFWDLYDDVKAGGHTEYWLKGGRGSCKSSVISLIVVMGILRDPDANAIIYRRVGNTCKDSVYAQISWAIGVLNVTHLFKFGKSPLEIIYTPTGQRILFRGADDPMKSKSIKLDRGYFKYLWFEELSEFRGMEDIRTIKQSAFRGVEHGVTFYSYNPPRSAQTWVNAEAIRSDPARMVHHSTYLEVPPDWLGRQFIADAEALKETNYRAYENEYLGNVTGTGGQVFDNIQVRRITDDEIKEAGTFYNGLDFGFANDPDALTRWAFSKRTRMLYAVGEYYGSHTLTDTLAEKIKLLCGREVVWSDSEDARTIEELRRRGLNTIGVKKGPGSVRAGIKWLQNLAGIVVDPARTPNIAREFSAYEYIQDRFGNFLPDVPDRDNHTIDSGRYALNQLIQQNMARTRNDII